MSAAASLIRYVASHPGTRGRRTHAVARVLWFQLRRRFTAKPLRARLSDGSTLLVFPGRPASTAAYYVGLPDFEEMHFALRILDKGDLFLDCGANVGVWTLVAATTGCDVTAIEPVPDTFALLRRQIEANQFAGRVVTVQTALAARTGTVRMTTGLDVGNRVEESAAGIEVPAVTIDDLLAGSVPALIKLDLEGYELEALRGANKTLARPELRAVICETFRGYSWAGDELRALETFLAGFGFSPCGYDPKTRSLARLPGLDSPPGDSGQNTIYVRDVDAVAARLRSSAGGG